jgi:hypothetical protein
MRRLSNDCLVIMVGRTGVQLGASFLRGLDAEYGHFRPQGPFNGTRSLRKSTFFLPPDRNGSAVALPKMRAVAVDLDSRSVDDAGIRSRIVASLRYTGGGAEMLWPEGYREAAKLEQEIMGVLEAGGVQAARNVIMFHATAAGTGSGVGSYVVDLLRRKYSPPGAARNLLNFTVIPSGLHESSSEFEEVSTPSFYNTVLTLNTLLGKRPGGIPLRPHLRQQTVVFDNATVGQRLTEAHGRAPKGRGFEDINAVIARVALALTAPLRYGPTDLGNIMVHLGQGGLTPLVVPALSPIAKPSPDDEPLYQEVYRALQQGTLAAVETQDIQRAYLLLRGPKVERSEVRHAHDLLRGAYGVSGSLFTIVDHGLPGVPREVMALLNTRGLGGTMRRIDQRARRNFDEGRSLSDYEAWGFPASEMDRNLRTFEDLIAASQRAGGVAP